MKGSRTIVSDPRHVSRMSRTTLKAAELNLVVLKRTQLEMILLVSKPESHDKSRDLH